METYYDKDVETDDTIVDNDGLITLTKYFKYLGFIILLDLHDSIDINERMKTTN